MTLAATALRTCPCGTVLSAYNRDPAGLCAPCRRREDARANPGSGVDLEQLVAGLLLLGDALHPGEPVNLIRDLAAMGIAADCWQVGAAVRHAARRHGLIARGVRGRPGYRLVEWERRYKPAHGFGVVMERDPLTGQWTGAVACALPQREEVPEVADPQLSLVDAIAGESGAHDRHGVVATVGTSRRNRSGAGRG